MCTAETSMSRTYWLLPYGSGFLAINMVNTEFFLFPLYFSPGHFSLGHHKNILSWIFWCNFVEAPLPIGGDNVKFGDTWKIWWRSTSGCVCQKTSQHILVFAKNIRYFLYRIPQNILGLCFMRHKSYVIVRCYVIAKLDRGWGAWACLEHYLCKQDCLAYSERC